MGSLKCRIEDYYREPREKALAGIDLDIIREASIRNVAAFQKAWDGADPEVLPVVSQPSTYNFVIERGGEDRFRMAYRDSVNAQLKAIVDAARSGATILPMVLCDFNVLTLSSLFDPDLVASAELDDANVLPVFQGRGDLEKLEKPDINQGLFPIVIEETKRLRSLVPDFISVGVRMNTGPLSLASELRGATETIYDMLEAPELYHHLMGILTDLYIEARKKIHEVGGSVLSKGRVHADVSFHTPTNGVCVCDDAIALLGPSQFEEFAAPYIIRILDTFGGGTIHSCGNSMQLWPVLRTLPGWDAFEFGEPDLVDWKAARKEFPEKRLVFWDCKLEGEEYIRNALEAVREPRTFIFSVNNAHIERWRDLWQGARRRRMATGEEAFDC